MKYLKNIANINHRTKVKRYDNKFQIWYDNEEEFNKIVSQEMMKKIQRFHSIYDQIAIEFYNKKIYIALDMRASFSFDQWYESFEPDYNKGTDYQYQIDKIKKDTKFITDAIDIFCIDL